MQGHQLNGLQILLNQLQVPADQQIGWIPSGQAANMLPWINATAGAGIYGLHPLCRPGMPGDPARQEGGHPLGAHTSSSKPLYIGVSKYGGFSLSRHSRPGSTDRSVCPRPLPHVPGALECCRPRERCPGLGALRQRHSSTRAGRPVPDASGLGLQARGGAGGLSCPMGARPSTWGPSRLRKRQRAPGTWQSSHSGGSGKPIPTSLSATTPIFPTWTSLGTRSLGRR
mmetsp:Transcript_32759/g.80395  ORF Transcript_32759/g.80395 Transcript_32759/m.80395 type:complete len:227 (-) Transcript_32759:680-1360(-)